MSASADAGGGASRTSRALAFVGSIDAAAGLATVSAGYLGCDVRFALLLIGCAALSASTVIALRWHAEANAPTQRAA